MPKLIDHWGTVLRRSAVTWTTAALTFLVGALAQTYMALFAFLAFMPALVQIAVGGFLVVIVVGGPIILARLVEQPALNAKLEEKNNAEPAPNSPAT